MKLTLTRHYSEGETVGILALPGQYFCTLELPWRDNERFISCIPEGEYFWFKWDSPRFGRCVRLADVEGRTAILMHVLNNVKQTLGCIGVGREWAGKPDVDGDEWIARSGEAFKEFLSVTPDSGTLVITSATGVPSGNKD